MSKDILTLIENYKEKNKTKFEHFISLLEEKYGDKLDLSNLFPEYIPHFNAGKNHSVHIKFNDSQYITFGWISAKVNRRPQFVLIKNKGFNIKKFFFISKEVKIIKYIDQITGARHILTDK